MGISRIKKIMIAFLIYVFIVAEVPAFAESGSSYMLGYSLGSINQIGSERTMESDRLQDQFGIQFDMFGFVYGDISRAPLSKSDYSALTVRAQGFLREKLKGNVRYLDLNYPSMAPWYQKDICGKNIKGCRIPEGFEFQSIFSTTSRSGVEFNNWMDFVADSILLLEQQGVQVFIRPFHESNGTWFWWGRQNITTDQYKALWVALREHLVRKGIKKAMWVYAIDVSDDIDEGIRRYPGDSIVDVIGLDFYGALGGRTRYGLSLQQFIEWATHSGKPIAISELGAKIEKSSDRSECINWGDAFDYLDHHIEKLLYVQIWGGPYGAMQNSNPIGLRNRGAKLLSEPEFRDKPLKFTGEWIDWCLERKK